MKAQLLSARSAGRHPALPARCPCSSAGSRRVVGGLSLAPTRNTSLVRVAAVEEQTDSFQPEQPLPEAVPVPAPPSVLDYDPVEVEALELEELDQAQEDLLKWMMLDETAQEEDLDEMVDYDEFGDEEFAELHEEVEEMLEEVDYDFKVGDKVTGTVIEVDDDGAYVEIGAKAIAFCPVTECSFARLKTVRRVHGWPLAPPGGGRRACTRDRGSRTAGRLSPGAADGGDTPQHGRPAAGGCKGACPASQQGPRRCPWRHSCRCRCQILPCPLHCLLLPSPGVSPRSAALLLAAECALRAGRRCAHTAAGGVAARDEAGVHGGGGRGGLRPGHYQLGRNGGEEHCLCWVTTHAQSPLAGGPTSRGLLPNSLAWPTSSSARACQPCLIEVAVPEQAGHGWSGQGSRLRNTLHAQHCSV